MSETNIKALEWSEPAPPTKDVCHYDHCHADTPFGRYQIEWKSWKDYPGYTVEAPWEWIGTEDTLEAAKLSAQADFERRVSAAIASSLTPSEDMK